MSNTKIIADELERIRADAESFRKAFMDGAMGGAAYQQAMDRLNVEAALLDRLLDEIAKGLPDA